MPRELTLVTPENVEIRYTLAGLGSRFAAAAVDALLQVLLLALIVLPMGIVGSSRPGLLGGDLQIALAVLGIVAVFLFLVGGYYLLFETLWNGQTPGKRLLGIRVIQENGRPLDFFTSAARNVLRVVDMLPVFYLVGIVSVFLSARCKRLGDYVAGTVVVKEYRPQDAPKRRSGKRREFAKPEPLEERELSSSIPRSHLITREEYEIAQRLLARRGELSSETKARLARQIAQPLMRKLGYTPEEDSEAEHLAFLEEVIRSYLRRDRLDL